MWDIVQFCRDADIFCQGRGSAANSAVCYALGITNADAVSLGLLFERFLSPERDGPPDIDIDIESDRREEAIQYVYAKHGRQHAAQVANVITYRAKSSIRDMAKALGYATGQQDAWTKQVDPWGPVRSDRCSCPTTRSPTPVLDLALQVEHFPRHLGIHSGGMVICDRPVIEVCPVEWARFTGRNGIAATEPIRTVLQWDKDDCAAVGLVKFDLLGLGMLSAVHRAVDLVRDAHGDEIDLATIPQDDAVYDMLCRADSVGVFQVESRAQMATLPRLQAPLLLRPRRRDRPHPPRPHPGRVGAPLHPPPQRRGAGHLPAPAHRGGAGQDPRRAAVPGAAHAAGHRRRRVHRRRSPTSCARRWARSAAASGWSGCTGASHEGAGVRGVDAETIEVLWEKLAAFANYGFPESHSVCFAYLVYASSWLKRWYPAAFCAGLLERPADGLLLAALAGAGRPPPRRRGAQARPQRLGGEGDPRDRHRHGPWRDRRRRRPRPWGDGGPAVRLGIGSVRGIGDDLAGEIAAGRPYASMEDLRRRVPALTLAQLEALATAGAFERASALEPAGEALWQAGAVAQSTPDRLAGIVTGAEAPRAAGHGCPRGGGGRPVGHRRVARGPPDPLRPRAPRRASASSPPPGCAGVTTGERVARRRRRHPPPAPGDRQGTTFVNLEDETGFVNVVVSKGCWARYRRVARSAPALLVRGRVEREEGVINVIAERLEPLPLDAAEKSRDFR